MLDVLHVDLRGNALLPIAVDGKGSSVRQERVHLRSQLESYGRVFRHVR